jgi:hypothetical protein
MMFRSLFFVLSLLLCYQLAWSSPHGNKILHGSRCRSSALSIASVCIKKHGHDDFVRIGEYFNGGVEYRGNRCIVRDDENARAGTYFIVNFNVPLDKLPPDLTVNIYVLAGRALVPEKFEFKLPNERKSFVAEVYCGVTSKRVDLRKINAWKIEVVGRDGDILLSHRSYMWPKNA